MGTPRGEATVGDGMTASLSPTDPRAASQQSLLTFVEVRAVSSCVPRHQLDVQPPQAGGVRSVRVVLSRSPPLIAPYARPRPG
jgi:hypothetical protein